MFCASTEKITFTHPTLEAQTPIPENEKLWIVHNLKYSGLLDATYQGGDYPDSLLLYKREAMEILWDQLNNSLTDRLAKDKNGKLLCRPEIPYVRVVSGAPGVGK